MSKIQDTAGFLFIFCVALLSAISVLGIWDFFDDDVIGKSFMSIGILAAVAVIVMVAGRFMDKQHMLEVSPGSTVATEVMPAVNPAFTALRHITLVTLIISVSLLALVGILAIWEVLEGDTVYKSLATMGVFAFSSAIIVLTCLVRENHPLLRHELGKKSGMGRGMIVFVIIFGVWMLSWLFSSFF
jgi:hypothetical protein